MTNPNNAIGTNAAYSGRTSPNAFNDITASFTAGIVSGWECVPKTGMTVKLGGVAGTRDVALAEDNAGNKLTINNRSGAPVEVTLAGAPSTNNRVDAIVAYVDNPSTGDDNTTDNPTTCGIIAVSGTVAANPTAPSEATIRSAITTDGATGGTAYYVVLATIYVGTNVTTIGSGVITAGAISKSQLEAEPADDSVTTNKLADGAVTSEKIDWTTALEIVGTTTGDFNYGIKFADGRLICLQRYSWTGKSSTTQGSVFVISGVMTPKNYAVEFTGMPAVSATYSTSPGSYDGWLGTDYTYGKGSASKPAAYQIYRGYTGNNTSGSIDIIAYGFWR